MDVGRALVVARPLAGVWTLKDVLSRHTQNKRIGAQADGALALQYLGMCMTRAGREHQRPASPDGSHPLCNRGGVIMPQVHLMSWRLCEGRRSCQYAIERIGNGHHH